MAAKAERLQATRTFLARTKSCQRSALRRDAESLVGRIAEVDNDRPPRKTWCEFLDNQSLKFIVDAELEAMLSHSSAGRFT